MKEIQKHINAVLSNFEALEKAAEALMNKEAKKAIKTLSANELAELLTTAANSKNLLDLNKAKTFIRILQNIRKEIISAELYIIPKTYDPDDDVRYGCGR
ncbi:hypothetical protein LCGC14_1099920 [marine sediment metagenome]|uniref:Uncharacterized protein n=1 Tax=marine sediment metagenome TaxID=412755 RepID=A0A0F9M9V3_9ZZZZ